MNTAWNSNMSISFWSLPGPSCGPPCWPDADCTSGDGLAGFDRCTCLAQSGQTASDSDASSGSVATALQCHLVSSAFFRCHVCWRASRRWVCSRSQLCHASASHGVCWGWGVMRWWGEPALLVMARRYWSCLQALRCCWKPSCCRFPVRGCWKQQRTVKKRRALLSWCWQRLGGVRKFVEQ